MRIEDASLIEHDTTGALGRVGGMRSWGRPPYR